MQTREELEREARTGFRHVLALDPGISTGFAIVRNDLKVVKTGTLSIDQLDQLPTIDSGEIDFVIMENTIIPTRSKMNRQLDDVYGIITRRYPVRYDTYPGIWKTSAQANITVGNTEGITRHEIDAIRIGWFYWAQVHGKTDQYGGHRNDNHA